MKGQITSFRRPDIQGLRALAVILVVAFHAGLPVPGGFVGVDVFFVISGFVVTGMLSREWKATGRINFLAFYLRRLQRLAPALALMITFTIVASVLVLSPVGSQQTAAKTAMGAVLLSANVVIVRTTGGYFDAPAALNPLLNTWSLSVEEQFYLVFPVLLASAWFVQRRTVLRAAPVLIMASVASVSFGLAAMGSIGYELPKASWLIGFYSPMTRLWEFSAGVILSLLGSRTIIKSRTFASLIALAGLTLLLTSLLMISSDTPFPGFWTVLPVAGTTLLILSGDDASNPFTKALSVRPLVKIGDWSYSIYLWHWPFVVMAGVLSKDQFWSPALATVLSLAPALASYHFVEVPIRSIPNLGRTRAAVLLSLTIGIPLLFAMGLHRSAQDWFGNESLRTKMAKVQSYPTGWNNPVCISPIPVNHRAVRPCQWNTSATGVPVYLIGDSNAMHFSEALKGAGVRLERPVTALGSDGCPLIDVYIKRSREPRFLERCREDYVALVNWLKEQPAGIVMISSVDRYWRDRGYLIHSGRDFSNANIEGNARALNDGLKRTVLSIQAAGHSVALIQTIPHFTALPYRTEDTVCSGWSVLVGSCDSPSVSMPVNFADTLQRASRDGIRGVGEETGASIVDLRGYFCPNGRCETRGVDGTDLYMLDGYHLNRYGSALLSEAFGEEIARASNSTHIKKQPRAGGRESEVP